MILTDNDLAKKIKCPLRVSHSTDWHRPRVAPVRPHGKVGNLVRLAGKTILNSIKSDPDRNPKTACRRQLRLLSPVQKPLINMGAIA